MLVLVPVLVLVSVPVSVLVLAPVPVLVSASLLPLADHPPPAEIVSTGS